MRLTSKRVVILDPICLSAVVPKKRLWDKTHRTANTAAVYGDGQSVRGEWLELVLDDLEFLQACRDFELYSPRQGLETHNVICRWLVNRIS